jgi:hypothetical protein
VFAGRAMADNSGMRLTPRQLNRATLARQLLLRREPLDVVDAVRRIVAIQAQEPASPYIALWNRIAGFDPAELDAAFADHSVVKASLIRITLHAVHADDYPVFHNAMAPSLRASRLTDTRFEPSGLSIADVDRLLPDFIRSVTRPHTVAELEARLVEQLGEPRERLWWALRTLAPLMHVPTGGPWSFGPRASFVAPPTILPPERHGASVRWLVRRYLEGFGPAAVRDVAQFTVLRVPVVREAIRELGDELVRLDGPDGAELYDVPGGLLPSEDAAAPPRLLPMWDSVLLAYADRSRMIAPDDRKIVIRQNGDVLPTLLVDGHVAGVWRPVEDGVEVSAFRALSDDAWEGITTEARSLVAFLAGRDPKVYRRYAHWWKTLPNTEVRVLPG